MTSSKKGVRRLQPTSAQPASTPELRALLAAKEQCTEEALRHLILARDYLRRAGACYTLAKVRVAISSARGAVRAAGYRSRMRRAG